MSCSIFDVTGTNSVKTADVSLKNVHIGICEEYLNFIPSEAGFSVDLGAKISGFILFLDFVHKCLISKVCAVNY